MNPRRVTTWRSVRLVVTSLLTLGVAAVAIYAAYAAFITSDLRTREGDAIAALTQASLLSQSAERRIVPASASTLAGPAAALARAPLESDPLVRAALRASLDGRDTVAREIMRAALRRDPRSRPAHLWSMTDALKRGNIADSATDAGLLMVLSRNDEAGFYPMLLELATHRTGETSIAAALSRNPYWRPGFLRYLNANSKDSSLAFRLTARASAETVVEAGLLEDLVRRGEYERAYLAWINFLPDRTLGQVDTVYDGSFVGLDAPRPFNWTFTDSEAASVGIERGEGLQIDYSGGQSTSMISQTLLLRPGRYRLRYVASGSPDTPEGGVIAWHVTCLPDHTALLEAPLGGLRDAAQGYAVVFSVPPACRAQQLSIDGASGTFPQRRSVSIRRVAIVEATR